MEELVQTHGDLIYDLCESILWNPTNAQVAFRKIVLSIKRNQKANSFDKYQRSWILRVAYEKLQPLARKHARRISAAEQIEIDSQVNVSTKLKSFGAFFHRLNVEDRILLLLRDKYGLSYLEIASVMRLPEATLKTRRQQALRALEEWIWES